MYVCCSTVRTVYVYDILVCLIIHYLTLRVGHCQGLLLRRSTVQYRDNAAITKSYQRGDPERGASVWPFSNTTAYIHTHTTTAAATTAYSTSTHTAVAATAAMAAYLRSEETHAFDIATHNRHAYNTPALGSCDDGGPC